MSFFSKFGFQPLDSNLDPEHLHKRDTSLGSPRRPLIGIPSHRSACLIYLFFVLAPLAVAVALVSGVVKALLVLVYLVLMAFLAEEDRQAKRAYRQQQQDQHDQELCRLQEAENNLAQKELMSDLAYEIRTPLNSISGMTTLLLDEDLGQRSQEFVTIIRKSGDAVLQLIEKMPGSVQTSVPDISKARIDVHECSINVMEMFQSKAASKGIALISQLDDLPRSASFIKDNYLEQVLVNLLSNALENTEQGSITLAASCQDMGNDQMCIEFSVADTGQGLPAGNLEKVFDPQASGSATTGSGLGLPMSRGLTELMDGQIWIESTEGKGTTVRFTISVRVDPCDASWQSATAIVGDTGAGFSSNLGEEFPHQILIAEDHAINRRVLSQLLKKMGYEADVAVDGVEAVAAAKAKDYDLIFMDIRMPNMDGFEATRWIRAHYNNKRLRIVALTGDATRESRVRCLSSGMNDFVPKPVQLKDLEEILRYSGPLSKRSDKFDDATFDDEVLDDEAQSINQIRIQQLDNEGVARVLVA